MKALIKGLCLYLYLQTAFCTVYTGLTAGPYFPTNCDTVPAVDDDGVTEIGIGWLNIDNAADGNSATYADVLLFTDEISDYLDCNTLRDANGGPTLSGPGSTITQVTVKLNRDSDQPANTLDNFFGLYNSAFILTGNYGILGTFSQESSLTSITYVIDEEIIGSQVQEDVFGASYSVYASNDVNASPIISVYEMEFNWIYNTDANVASLTPNTAEIDSGDVEIIIQGSGFVQSMDQVRVKVAGKEGTVSSVEASAVVATISAPCVGKAPVEVSLDSGTSWTTNGAKFDWTGRSSELSSCATISNAFGLLNGDNLPLVIGIGSVMAVLLVAIVYVAAGGKIGSRSSAIRGSSSNGDSSYKSAETMDMMNVETRYGSSTGGSTAFTAASTLGRSSSADKSKHGDTRKSTLKAPKKTSKATLGLEPPPAGSGMQFTQAEPGVFSRHGGPQEDGTASELGFYTSTLTEMTGGVAASSGGGSSSNKKSKKSKRSSSGRKSSRHSSSAGSKRSRGSSSGSGPARHGRKKSSSSKRSSSTNGDSSGGPFRHGKTKRKSTAGSRAGKSTSPTKARRSSSRGSSGREASGGDVPRRSGRKSAASPSKRKKSNYQKKSTVGQIPVSAVQGANSNGFETKAMDDSQANIALELAVNDGNQGAWINVADSTTKSVSGYTAVTRKMSTNTGDPVTTTTTTTTVGNEPHRPSVVAKGGASGGLKLGGRSSAAVVNESKRVTTDKVSSAL